jgi:hypothetical protein
MTEYHFNECTHVLNPETQLWVLRCPECKNHTKTQSTNNRDSMRCKNTIKTITGKIVRCFCFDKVHRT